MDGGDVLGQHTRERAPEEAAALAPQAGFWVAPSAVAVATTVLIIVTACMANQSRAVAPHSWNPSSHEHNHPHPEAHTLVSSHNHTSHRERQLMRGGGEAGKMRGNEVRLGSRGFVREDGGRREGRPWCDGGQKRGGAHRLNLLFSAPEGDGLVLRAWQHLIAHLDARS